MRLVGRCRNSSRTKIHPKRLVIWQYEWPFYEKRSHLRCYKNVKNCWRIRNGSDFMIGQIFNVMNLINFSCWRRNHQSTWLIWVGRITRKLCRIRRLNMRSQSMSGLQGMHLRVQRSSSRQNSRRTTPIPKIPNSIRLSMKGINFWIWCDSSRWGPMKSAVGPSGRVVRPPKQRHRSIPISRRLINLRITIGFSECRGYTIHSVSGVRKGCTREVHQKNEERR